MDEARAAWSTVAEGYARQSDVAFAEGAQITEWLLDGVGAAPGRTILELAAGPGMVSIAAAERGASVICTDFAPGMIEVAERAAAEAGVTGIDFRVMDAMNLDLADDSVDGVLCRFGVMLMDDPEAALSEARRVLRPGESVAYAVWGPADANRWASVIPAASIALGFESSPPPALSPMFSLPDEASNATVARAAGFTHVEVSELRPRLRFPSFDAYWDLRLAASITARTTLATLTSEQVAELRRAAEESCSHARASDGSLVFDTFALGVRAS